MSTRGARHLLPLALLLAPATQGNPPSNPQADLDFFENKIRPVLVEHCHDCHSARSKKLKGGLHLDSRAGLLKGGDTGPAIVPGDPANSRLVEAVRWENDDLQMPPKKPLAASQVADLVEWIRIGAPWPGSDAAPPAPQAAVFDLEQRKAAHWAWRPPGNVQPPAVRQSAWPANPVDRFLLAKLEQHDLQPAPPADKRTLVRRLHLDLTGLPPTPAETEAFLADTSPEACENLVDRLLASPRFGERWARHWLDLVRYSETLGHEFDYTNFNAWRYRDYVIRAFNADLPYDRFVTEHIAGDLLENPRLHPAEGFNESVIGTGFYWLGQRVHSPVDVRLEQAEVVDNQIDVTTKTFLGLTVACARCHDHKFDAISSRDYYGLFGILGSARHAQRSLESPAAIAARVDSLQPLKNALRPRIAAAWLAQAARTAAYLTAAAAGPPDPADETRLRELAAAAQLDPARLAAWIRALADPAASQPAHPARAWTRFAQLRHQAANPPFADAWRKIVDETRDPPPAATNDDTETLGDFSGSDLAGWFAEDEAFGTSPDPAGGFVAGDAKRPVLALLTSPAAHSARVSRRLQGTLRSPTFVIRKRFAHILAAGSGARINVRVDSFTMIRDPIYGSLKRPLDQDSLRWITIDLGQWTGHRAYLEFNDLPTPDPSDDANARYPELAHLAVARVVLTDNPAPPPPAPLPSLPAPDSLATAASPEQVALLCQQAATAAIQAWSAPHDTTTTTTTTATPAQLALLEWLNRHGLLDPVAPDDPAAPELTAALDDLRKTEDSLPERARAPGMVDGTGTDEPVFIRGNHKSPGELVPRRFLEALGGTRHAPVSHGSGRLELARQITNPANPFTSRVFVNRVWHHLFGRGIVATPDDFGVLGEAPSHPELLDWLARWFRDDAGWSAKKLVRLLVTSNAYRMSSSPADPRAEAADPQNILLHRMPVRRLQAEAIRDSILATSGQLDPAMFGPPVPVHLTEFMDGRGRPPHSGPLNGAGRRSIYQEVRRNFLPPMMRTFDFPVPFTTIGRRTVSNVPAQSLVLMNDPFVADQAKAWANTSLASPDLPPQQRVASLYQTLLNRPPAPHETSAALDFLAKQAATLGIAAADQPRHPALWADLCHVLFNLKEFTFLH